MEWTFNGVREWLTKMAAGSDQRSGNTHLQSYSEKVVDSGKKRKKQKRKQLNQKRSPKKSLNSSARTKPDQKKKKIKNEKWQLTAWTPFLPLDWLITYAQTAIR